MKRPLTFSLIVAGSLLGGCSIDSLPFVYKPDIHQGTILTQEMVDQLRLGMTRRQVQFVLGSPPLADPFHADRWDYIEAVKPGGKRFQSRRMTVFFDNDRLAAIEGDWQPQSPAARQDG
jgi:outer membrane protein assembly factor BamE